MKHYAIIEKYAYLKTPQWWVNVSNDLGGSSRIGPFRSLKAGGRFLRTYSPDLPVTVKIFHGWDENENMIIETLESYNFKLFGGAA